MPNSSTTLPAPSATPAPVAVVQADREAACKHKFSGWRDHEDGLGGEAICERCGIGAMAYTLSLDI